MASNVTDMWVIAGVTTPGSPNNTNTARITFSSDTNTASQRGAWQQTDLAASSYNTSDVWVYGGTTARYSTVSRMTFASDTSLSQVVGPLTVGVQSPFGFGNETDGWVAGGMAPSPSNTSAVYRRTYANDSGAFTKKGSLAGGYYRGSSTWNLTDAWLMGGSLSTSKVSTISRVEFGNDTITAPTTGQLALAVMYAASSKNSTDAWIYGGEAEGYPSTFAITNIQRITFSTGSISSSLRGHINAQDSSIHQSSKGNVTDGWVAGGSQSNPASGNTSRVVRLSYSTDTSLTTFRGNLFIERKQASVG